MPSLEGVINILGKLEGERIAVHEERCIAVRNRNADCLRCAEACTSGCISYAENELSIDPELCIGCGSCATACPTCAIELKEPDDALFMRQAKSVIKASQGHPTFSCERALAREDDKARAGLSSWEAARRRKQLSFDESRVCRVPCLGRIDEAVLAGMAAYGCFETTLVHADCASCPHAPGGALARAVVDSARGLLDAYGCAMPVRMTDRLPESVLGWHNPSFAPGMDRREFLREAGGAARTVASEAAAESLGGAEPASEPSSPAYRKVGPDGALSQFVPTRRVRTYNYLRHIGEPVRPTITSRVVGSVSIDGEACTSCRMCAVFCSTGAIKKEDDRFFGVVHRPSLCVQCRLCESLCPAGAIEVSSVVPAAQFAGRKAVAFRMKEPAWKPNRPDSMFNKIHSIIGEDLEMCAF